ncbi:MAG: hypothetical protein NC453_13440 [Muribaculum sp.]|nr:hypothetical protein [Muribaculum sp.]
MPCIIHENVAVREYEIMAFTLFILGILECRKLNYLTKNEYSQRPRVCIYLSGSFYAIWHGVSLGICIGVGYLYFISIK